MIENFRLPRPRYAIIIIATALATYWLAVPDRVPEQIAVAILSLVVTVSTMVFAVYGVSVWYGIREEASDQSYGLILGICIGFLADVILGIVWLWWIFAGQPDNWIGRQIWLFPSFMTTIAGVCHIAAPGSIEGRIPKRNLILIVTSVGLAGIATGIVIASMLPPGTLRILPW